MVLFLSNAIRAYSIFRLMRIFCTAKVKKFWMIMAYLCYATVTVTVFYLFQKMYINSAVSLAGLFLITLCYEDYVLKKLLMVLLSYGLNSIIEAGVMLFFSYTPETELSLSALYNGAASFVFLIVVFFIEFLFKKKSDDHQMHYYLWICLILIPFISGVLIFLLLHNYIDDRRIIVQMSIGLFAINLIIFYFYYTLQDYHRQKSEKEQFERTAEIYSNQLLIQKDTEEKMKILRHDMRHHFGELNYLLKEGKTAEMEQYLKEMEDYLKSSKEYVSSGNIEIDSTLNFLLRKADGLLKNVEIHISIPAELNFHTYYVNTIIGNLLENAMEASEKSAEKYLRMDLKMSKGLMLIKIENSYSGKVIQNGGELLTRKQEKFSHGLGLKSVKKIVEEMDGTFQYEWSDNVFQVFVSLYIGDICRKENDSH